LSVGIQSYQMMGLALLKMLKINNDFVTE